MRFTIPGRIEKAYLEFMRFSKFFYKTITGIKYVFVYWRDTVAQMHSMGNLALPLVLTAAASIGMVLTLEWGTKLEPFGAKPLTGRLVAISVIRVIGPTITGLMIAARSGAKLVSEIGNMVLTEQVDALRAFGTDPIKRLIVPRVFASIFVMAPLAAVADVIGIIGGWFIAVNSLGVESEVFWLGIRNGLTFKDLLVGGLKPPFYGLWISIIACYMGITVTGGSVGLGRAATLTAMLTSISVLLMDFFITKIIVALY
jgi:phospholipid/cholesterol/gamma-HCH transport system permease protein